MNIKPIDLDELKRDLENESLIVYNVKYIPLEVVNQVIDEQKGITCAGCAVVCPLDHSYWSIPCNKYEPKGGKNE